jgi:translation initiation factor 2 alpha subunit (eIF-2alpha)
MKGNIISKLLSKLRKEARKDNSDFGAIIKSLYVTFGSPYTHIAKISFSMSERLLEASRTKL